MLEVLKVYCMMGWPLFPCQAQGPKAKAPFTPHGFKDASLDRQQIEAWHRQYPDCAWGVATSAERAVLDVDVHKGGLESFNKLVAEYGALPPTPKVLTGSGGYHFWLRCPAGTSCGKPYPGIDRKADGGYVIVPPSRIAVPEHEGRAYAWEVRPWEMKIAEAPAWFLVEKQKQKHQQKASAEAETPWAVQAACAEDLLTHPGSPEGERRKTLCQLVGIHLARGDSSDSIKLMAEAWAKRCSPPFEEWQKHVLGLLRRDAERRTTISSLPPLAGLGVGKEGINSAEAYSHQASAEEELIPSFRENAESGDRLSASEQEAIPLEASPDGSLASQSGEPEPSAQADWPTLPADAYHGLLGKMLVAISPQTEADPAGILLGWLCCFGNVVGRGAWVTVGPRLHHPALYIGIVGKTSDAKGDGWAASLWPFQQLEPAWASQCIAHGVGSGEGLLERIADPQTLIDKKGNAQIIPGASDKR